MPSPRRVLAVALVALGAALSAGAVPPADAPLPPPMWPVSAPAADDSPGAEPAAVVLAMIAALERGDPDAYVRHMTEDYVFWSDEPGFGERYPRGLSRDDERGFADHLLIGGGHGRDGRRLLPARSVRCTPGPITRVALESADAQARVVLHDLGVVIELVDGTVIEVGGTQNVVDLVLSESGWRVRRWIELHTGRGEAELLAGRLGEREVDSATIEHLIARGRGRPTAWRPPPPPSAWRRDGD